MESIEADLLRLTKIDRDTSLITFLYGEARREGLYQEARREAVAQQLEHLCERGWVSRTPDGRWLITAAGAQALSDAEKWELVVTDVCGAAEQATSLEVTGEVRRGSVFVAENFSICRGGVICGGGRILSAVPGSGNGMPPVHLTLVVHADATRPGDVLTGEVFSFDQRKVPEDLPPLEYLVAWYADHCDGDWEHALGIRLGTLDNPGWHLQVDLVDTGLEGRVLPRDRIDRSDSDWVDVQCNGSTYEALGGVSNLAELLAGFRRFSVSQGRFRNLG